MNIAHTVRMVSWRLKQTMEMHGVTRYALQKRTGVAMNTLRAMYDGETLRPDLKVLDRIVQALRDMTGTAIELKDVLEYTPNRDG